VVFWDDLTEDDRLAVAAAGRPRTYAAGSVVFVAGDEPRQVLVIRHGRLKLTRTALDGREVLIELRGPGDLIGELGAVADVPRSATATVAQSMEAIVVPAARFRQLLAERGTIALAVLTSVAEKLRKSADRRLELGTSDALGRLCSRLVELSADVESNADGVVEIPSLLTQQELAEWIGSSRDAVVLALRQLRERGWVETGRRRIKVLDIDAVRQAAET
jgi:CRP/FNR family transcriptional regulator, cyclic AMP receptor protein